MKRIIGIISTAISCLIVFAVLLTVFLGVSAFTFTSGRTTSKDYSNIIRKSITGNPLVVDIAMLGAHDAFSNAITTKSTVDPAEPKDSVVRNQNLMFFARGLSVRMTRAQKSGVSDLLRHGVRYFDARISYYEGNWYTKHRYISDKLEIYLLEMLEFLSKNDGEILVIDLQHVYGGSKNLGDLMSYIGSVNDGERSLLDYVNHKPYNIPLSTLTYNDATEGGAKSGVVILAPGLMDRNCAYYSYSESIRSKWHETNNTGVLFEEIDREYKYLKSDSGLDRDKFRVNQVVKTALYEGIELVPTVFCWSLLDMAERINREALSHKDFDEWLRVMPIFMVDYSDTMKGDFNDKVIEKINAYNKALA